MPVITVLMSCYNASAYLAEAIESVLSQTYNDYEFVAVNDGSTDNTLDILRKYASKDGRIRVLDKSNTGLADSLNFGIDAAQGRWIARIDADDVITPDRLARQLSFVKSHRSVVLLGAGCTLVDANGSRIRDYRYPRKHCSLVTHMAFGGASFPHSSAFFRKEAAIGIGRYNTRFARRQDLDLWLRLSQVGEIASVPELLVKKREHPAGISNDSMLTISLGLGARACHFIRTKGIPDPSWASDETTWKRFMNWLTRQMEKDAYIEFQRRWFGIRREFQTSLLFRGTLRTMLMLGWRVWSSGYASRIIREKFVGTRLPSRLADQWIQNEIRMQTICPGT